MADLHYRASLCKSTLKNRLCLSLSVGSTYQWKLAPKIAVLYPFMKSLIKIDKISARALMDSIVYMSPAKLRSTLEISAAGLGAKACTGSPLKKQLLNRPYP